MQGHCAMNCCCTSHVVDLGKSSAIWPSPNQVFFEIMQKHFNAFKEESPDQLRFSPPLHRLILPLPAITACLPQGCPWGAVHLRHMVRLWQSMFSSLYAWRWCVCVVLCLAGGMASGPFCCSRRPLLLQLALGNHVLFVRPLVITGCKLAITSCRIYLSWEQLADHAQLHK